MKRQNGCEAIELEYLIAVCSELLSRAVSEVSELEEAVLDSMENLHCESLLILKVQRFDFLIQLLNDIRSILRNSAKNGMPNFSVPSNAVVKEVRMIEVRAFFERSPSYNVDSAQSTGSNRACELGDDEDTIFFAPL